jgi:hypothetical protein
MVLEKRITRRIARTKRNVFLRADFLDLGDYDQVGRALRRLILKGELVKVGYGLYSRAAPSPFTGIPVPLKGIRTIAAEALTRLGVRTGQTQLERSYNEGRTTQVPSGRVIAVGKRVRRKIGYDGKYVSFERLPRTPRA